MAETKNLCAQISLDLHRQICEAREKAGLTTAQYSLRHNAFRLFLSTEQAPLFYYYNGRQAYLHFSSFRSIR